MEETLEYGETTNCNKVSTTNSRSYPRTEQTQ